MKRDFENKDYLDPVLGKDYKYVIELLRLCGSRNLSVKTFTERYNSVKYGLNKIAVRWPAKVVGQFFFSDN